MRRHDGVPYRLLVATLVAVAECSGAYASPFTVSPSASLSEQYNDNVFFNNDKTSDFITSFGLGLGTQYTSPRFTAALSGGTNAQYFAHSTSENNVFKNQSGALGVAYQVSPLLGLTLSDSVARVTSTRTGSVQPASEAPPANVEPPGPATQASTLLPRGDVFTNFFSTGATYTFYPRWSAGFTYSNAINDFSDPGGSELTNTVGTTLGYAWSPVLALNASFSYLRLSGVDGPDTETYNPSAGMSYQYDPTLSVNANAGVYVNRPVGGGSDSESTKTGPTVGASLRKQFALSALSLGASQSITTSAGVAGISTTRTAYLFYSVLLSSRLSASLGTAFSNFNTTQTDFDLLNVQASLSYPLWRYFSTGVSYNYSYRWADQGSSTLSAGSVDQNLVQVFISAAYPAWRGDL